MIPREVKKVLADYTDVFADIINVLLFKGKRLVQPEELVATTVKSMYKADSSKLHEMERDMTDKIIALSCFQGRKMKKTDYQGIYILW